MFNVHRYDPEAQKQKAKRKDVNTSKGNYRTKKGKHHNAAAASTDSNTSEVTTTTLHVIANEVVEPSSITTSKNILPEAFDDLDLLGEDLIATSLNEDEEKDNNNNPNIKTSIEESVLIDVTNSEIRTAIALSEMSLNDVAKGWKLVPFLINNLHRDQYEHFFPIQALSIPDVIASERHAHTIRSSDICITAPTGSGKTLAYVLPILNALATNNTNGILLQRRLRALIVLPSRDLATQVYNVFERYMNGSTLQVGLAIGQSDFIAEQIALTVNTSSNDIHMLQNRLLNYDPGNLELALQILRHTSSSTTTTSSLTSKPYIPRDGWSNVDVLVCTPGRLVDHLDHTPGFTLQHLRFLVVDEADRLLSQAYHKWIDRVLDATNHASMTAWNNMLDGKLPPLQQQQQQQQRDSGGGRNGVHLEPITWRRGGRYGDNVDNDHHHHHTIINTNESYTASKICQPIQLRKFLVSATLTRDPQKLAPLRLINPKHFNVHQLLSTKNSEGNNNSNNKYLMPTSLEECILECTAEQKPLILLSLLLMERRKSSNDDDAVATCDVNRRKRMSVVFTSSLDSTHRLARLLQLLWGALHYGSDSVGEFSSALNQDERSDLMKRCNDPDSNISIIVCSDGMSRGMDLEYVDTVINYDIPTLAKTYVHRCGRTARASRKGTAITLVKGGQNSLFYRMRNLIQDTQRVQTMQISKNAIASAVDVYRLCIKALREVLDAEANGELGHRESVSSYLPDS